MLFVTHSIEEAITLGNRILVLSPHPGQVRAELNSAPAGDRAAARDLAEKIHHLLFDDAEGFHG